MLWKCCTQYVSKFGKLTSGHRPGKDQFSLQSLRKAMPKNAQTTTQLHSSHTSKGKPLSLIRLFATPWTVAYQAPLSMGFSRQEYWSGVPLPFENFEHYLLVVWNECNFAAVWTFFGIAFLWDWNENWPFLDPWPLLSFPNLLTYWVQHFNSITF